MYYDDDDYRDSHINNEDEHVPDADGCLGQFLTICFVLILIYSLLESIHAI